ncbi:hypothetical protein IP90_00854 [Luteimonas cucumeris]|uniref:Uncharacterized protein n=1 Tax=Luteimonas cucumeris TaxID=985012 RepID=A0A562LAM3_9GAMM|nr:hypothetical protein [Luteimonas cucumeris]TWI04719.1 hypothetical protein IP90_00854 [Luteimonas cucumeris]
MSGSPRGSRQRVPWLWPVLLAATLLLSFAAQAASVKSRNLSQLIDESDSIVIGVVDKVEDGIDDRGVPYTEVTVKIAERLRGKDTGASYTFRQFGLIEPRKMDNGRTLMAVTPDGWPTYAKGEQVMLFLHKPAKLTGLQTTVGLNQGKFRISNNRARSAADNRGLFEGVTFAPGVLTKNQKTMVSARAGAVDANALIDVVRRAVKENWAATGRMKNER